MALPRLMAQVSSERRPTHVLWAWIAAFVLFSVLYVATMNTSMQGRDSGYFVSQAYEGVWRNPLGLVASHPLHYGLARLLTTRTSLPPFTAVPLLSALTAALTVANVLVAVLLITRSFPAAAVCAASLGLAHSFWQMATVAEVYTLATLILSAELLAVLGYARRLRFRWLILAFFLNGLGCANHLQNLLSLPVLAALILAAVWRRPAKAYGLLVAAAAWSFGSLPYALLVIGDLAGGGGVRPTLQSALVGTWFSSVFNVLPTKSVLFTLAFFPLYNFPNLLLPLAVLGIWCARRLGLAPAIRVYLLGALALHALFVVRYSVSDQYTFFLPTYLLLTVLAGVGWRALEVCPSPAWRSAIRIAAAVLLLTTPLVYASAPALVRRTGLLNGVVADHPYDDAARRLLTPWSCTDRAVERATLHAYELAGRRGIILVEDLFQHAAGVKYYQDHAKMTDVLLRPLPKPDDQGRQQLASICDEAAHWRRTVVLMPAVRGVPPADPPGRHWRPDGDLYVLENRPATPSSPRR